MEKFAKVLLDNLQPQTVVPLGRPEPIQETISGHLPFLAWQMLHDVKIRWRASRDSDFFQTSSSRFVNGAGLHCDGYRESSAIRSLHSADAFRRHCFTLPDEFLRRPCVLRRSAIAASDSECSIVQMTSTFTSIPKSVRNKSRSSICCRATSAAAMGEAARTSAERPMQCCKSKNVTLHRMEKKHSTIFAFCSPESLGGLSGFSLMRQTSLCGQCEGKSKVHRASVVSPHFIGGVFPVKLPLLHFQTEVVQIKLTGGLAAALHQICGVRISDLPHFRCSRGEWALDTFDKLKR